MQDIISKAYNYYNKRNYKTYKSFPLLLSDKSLLFTNSTIAPFKPNLVNGEKIENLFLVQNCFRNHYKSDGLFGFRMLGTLGQIEKMNDIFDDSLFFLKNILKIEDKKLHIVIHKNDSDLLGYVIRRFSTSNIHFCKKDEKNYGTVWSFGEGELLTGRGLTLVIESSILNKCNHSCNVYCDCNYYFPIGNFIIIQSKMNTYVEVGIGIESIYVALLGVDYLMTPPYKEIISFLQIKKFTYQNSSKLAKYYVAGSILSSEGINPSNKKQGYVLKRIIRKIYEIILSEENYLQDIETILNEFITPKENEWGNFNKFKLQLLNNHKSYLETINKGIIQIEKDRKKNKLHTVDYYNSTLGIPVFIILKTLKNE